MPSRSQPTHPAPHPKPGSHNRVRARLTDEELALLYQLRNREPAQRAAKLPPPTMGQRVSDKVAAMVGSWRFIIIQSSILLCWIALNVTAYIQHWDPYPFILLNLMLSFQAAYTAPIIMMSQNRQSDIDRERAQNDYDVNLKAELEIESLHQKMDLLREQEVDRLIKLVEKLVAMLEQPESPGQKS